MRKAFHIILSIAALVAAMSFKPSDKPRLIIRFENVVDGKPLVLDSVTYHNALGQAFTVSKFKYYISNFTLTHTEVSAPVKLSSTFLINEEDTTSKTIAISYNSSDMLQSIGFTIGVDSIHNCSGAQSGALDPINAMFWAWNTGYIFVKMEGKSPVSQSPGHLLEFHIGGYRKPNNCIREVDLKLKKELLPAKDGNTYITIQVNVAELFKTPTPIDFSKLSSVTDFHNATTIADNYADMFSVKE